MHIRGQAFRNDMVGGRADILLLFFSPHLRTGELARSRANSQTSNLPPNPHILPRHRSTAELRVVGIETSRTESLTEEPSPGLNNLAVYVPSTHPRNVYQSLHWRNSFTQRVLSEKKGTAVHNVDIKEFRKKT